MGVQHESRIRRIVGLAAGLLLVGGLAALPAIASHGSATDTPLDPGAAGSPHKAPPAEPQPGAGDVEAVCSFLGTSDVSPGLSSVPAHYHYTFNSVQVSCVSADDKLHGNWEVTITGAADGPLNPAGTAHGAVCGPTWTHTPGDITSVSKTGSLALANNVDAQDPAGTLQFNGQHGWGSFTVTDNGAATYTVNYHTQVRVTPINVVGGGRRCAGLDPPINDDEVDLRGVAIMAR